MLSDPHILIRTKILNFENYAKPKWNNKYYIIYPYVGNNICYKFLSSL